VDRLRLDGDLDDPEVVRLRIAIGHVDQTLHTVALTEAILARAGEPFPTVVGTLDGLHLATALAVRCYEPIDQFLTHDQQLGRAAQALGFAVAGID